MPLPHGHSVYFFYFIGCKLVPELYNVITTVSCDFGQLCPVSRSSIFPEGGATKYRILAP